MSWIVNENMDEKSEEDKLVELKEMLIGKWILENRSWDDWNEYKERRNDYEWIWREGLVILLTEEMVDLMVDKSEDEVWRIFIYFISSSSVPSNAVQCSLVRLCNSVSDRVGGGGWKGLRVVSWVVGSVVNELEMEWSDETVDCVVNYLVKVIDECEEMEMVKWAILTGEKLWVKMKMSSEGRDRLRTALTRHSQTHSDTLVGEMDRLDLWDAERYQVGWCARWCVDNVFEVGVEEIPRVKLSRDRFEARCDDSLPTPVRSPFPVKSNVYFYEVICVTNGEIQVGWSAREASLDILYKLSEKRKNSVMLQVDNQCIIHHNNHLHPIPNPPSACPLNVFGCLFDVDNRRFEFYLNGRALDCPIRANFPHQPYFATALLSPRQQCHFNFGQCPFKFPPRNIRFTTFHEQTGGDERKYRLAVTEKYCGDYWFLHPPVDNQVSLFLDDEMQNEVNREVRRVEGDIENDRIGQWKWDGEMKNRFKGLRYIQAIIEVMGNVVRVDNLDLMAQWVGQVIEDVIDLVNLHMYKLLELLYPKLNLVITPFTLTQHRSICIVLLHLIKCDRHYDYYFIKSIQPSVFTYLTRTLTSSPDQWTQLFVLIALADLKISKAEKRHIEGCAKIGQILKACTKTFEGKDVAQFIKLRHEHRLQYQLYVCSNNLLKSFTSNFTCDIRSTSATSNQIPTLNPHDLTPQLTLSPCHLSARSDWHWQSVRSVCQVSAHIYYFEVVLLTAGPMTLGWATRRTDLTKFVVGGDEFSVGYNGYDRTIWNDNTEHPMSNIPRWNPGDVIGCRLDHANQKFAFTFNGQSLPIPPNIYFSSLPYHACVSLSPHQQVYFNFGQNPFMHPPKRIDFRYFHLHHSQILTEHPPSKPSITLNNVTVTSSLLTIDSQVTTEDITLQHISQSSTSNQISSSNRKRSSSVTMCDICQQPQSTKRLRFECCDHLKFCLNCAHVLGNCRKCLAEKQNRSQHRQKDDG